MYHVTKDKDHLFIPTESLSKQTYIKSFSHWTDQNLMLLNPDNSTYMLKTRAAGDYSTHLQLNNTMDWELNTMEICKKAYTRISFSPS